MKPARAIAELSELKVLRLAYAQAAEFQTGRARVNIEWRQNVRIPAVERVVNAAAEAVIKGLLTNAQMRTAMMSALAAKIAALEARYPGLVDGG